MHHDFGQQRVVTYVGGIAGVAGRIDPNAGTGGWLERGQRATGRYDRPIGLHDFHVDAQLDGESSRQRDFALCKTKFRKAHKGRIHGVAKGGTELAFGQYALKATEPERVTARQIEAARRAITREMKRQGRVWIRIFPDVPVSKKPTEVRMGKGKGSVEFWAARVKPGRIVFEIDGVPEDVAKEALRLGAMKLPIMTRVVTRIAD